MSTHNRESLSQIYARITERKINQDMEVLSKKLDPQAGVYKMPDSEYRARKSRKLRRGAACRIWHATYQESLKELDGCLR